MTLHPKVTYLHTHSTSFFPQVYALDQCPKCGRLGVAVPDGELTHWQCCGYYQGLHRPSEYEASAGWASYLSDTDRAMLKAEVDAFLYANKDRPVPVGECKDIERAGYIRSVGKEKRQPGHPRRYEIHCRFCGGVTVQIVTGKSGMPLFCDDECRKAQARKRYRESYPLKGSIKKWQEEE